MPSNHLILCHPLLFLPSIFPSIRVFSSESVLRIRWPKYWEFQLQDQSYQWDSGLISFRMDSLFKINLEKKKERRCLQPWTWHREPGLKIFPQGTTPAPSAGTPKQSLGLPLGVAPSGSLSPSQHRVRPHLALTSLSLAACLNLVMPINFNESYMGKLRGVDTQICL